MCCFSQSVQHVSNTSIFCRMGAHGNQVVIYSMLLESANEVAMVLPVPVSDQRDEDSVQFVDSLPRNQNNKFDRSHLADQFQDLFG